MPHKTELACRPQGDCAGEPK